MNWWLSILILSVPAGILMGVARLLGVASWWGLLVVAVVGAVLTGAFISSAASAMATAVNPQTATLRGAGIGLLAGIISWGIVYLIAKAIAYFRH